MSKSVVNKIVADAKVQEVRGTADPVKIWDGYRDQALMWRALLLLQLPITILALMSTLCIWQGRETIVKVPLNPAPGMYHPKEIPDRLFIDEANSFINLIATYTPSVARRQFTTARDKLLEPLLSKFNEQMMQEELKAIESTSRSQIFYVDPTKTVIERDRNTVVVTLAGDRQKMISTRPLPTVKSQFRVTMRTIPRNDINPYGIVITEVGFQDSEKGK